MKRKCSLVLTALIMTCFLTACQGALNSVSKNALEDRDLETVSSVEEEEESKTEETKAVTSLRPEENEELEQELYNTYININNFMVNRLSDSLDRYFDYVDIDKDEFTLLDADDEYFDCYSISSYDIEDFDRAYDIANGKSKKSTLDEAYLAMYPSVSTVMATLNNIDEYTELKSYLDDDYKKAQEYHTTLLSALAEYLQTGDVFMTELDVIANEHQSAALEMMKEEGYEVLYSVNMVIDLAIAIQSELYNQEVWDENILDMDLEKIQPLYDEFVANVEAVLEYSKDEEKLASEGIPYNSVSWDFFLDAVKDTKTSLTEVLQKVKKGEALSYSDMLITSIPGNCSLSSFETGITKMINEYNSMVSY